MTEAKQKRLYAEVASDMYYKGGLAICDLLQSALAGMPDQDAKISIREFMVVVAMARRPMEAESCQMGKDKAFAAREADGRS